MINRVFPSPPKQSSKFGLVEWVIDGGKDSERRITCLEQFIKDLERTAPNPETGLAAARAWAQNAIQKSDPYHCRLMAVLDELDQHLAGIRARERNEGRKISLS